jgi:hypothetical protein
MAGDVTIGALKRLDTLLAGQEKDAVDVTGGAISGTSVTLPVYTVATVPAAVAGGVIYVSDGAAGSPILAYSDGTDWLRSDTAAAIAAS